MSFSKTFATAVLTLMGIFSSCQDFRRANKVEIVVALKDGSFSFDDVDIKPGQDFIGLAHPHFELLGGVRYNRYEAILAVEKSTSFENLISLTTRLPGQSQIKPNLMMRDKTLVALDYETSMALTLYYNMSAITAFAKDNALMPNPENSMVRVSIFPEVYISAEHDVPLPWLDNESYTTSINMIAVLPQGREQGLPFGMNPGIVAHEYHHKLFFDRLWGSNVPGLWQVYLKTFEDKQFKTGRWRILMNGLDEGLADLFAVAFTESPLFFVNSLTSSKGGAVALQRDLNGDFAAAATYENLASGNLKKGLLSLCGSRSDNFTNPNFNNYCLGTVIASTFYEASERNFGELASLWLPAIHRGLASLAVELKNNPEKLSMELFFSLVADQIPGSNAKNRLCAQLKKKFASAAQALPCQ